MEQQGGIKTKKEWMDTLVQSDFAKTVLFNSNYAVIQDKISKMPIFDFLQYNSDCSEE